MDEIEAIFEVMGGGKEKGKESANSERVGSFVG
jgi:hypothetical protein